VNSYSLRRGTPILDLRGTVAWLAFRSVTKEAVGLPGRSE
jgi:hypothetical protein